VKGIVNGDEVDKVLGKYGDDSFVVKRKDGAFEMLPKARVQTQWPAELIKYYESLLVFRKPNYIPK